MSFVELEGLLWALFAVSPLALLAFLLYRSEDKPERPDSQE